MKLNVILLTILALCWVACDDTLDSIGTGMMPDDDQVTVESDEIPIDAETIKLDSLYMKSVSGYLGEYYDPVYGSIKASYLCQFYPQKNGMFPDSVYNNKIDSVELSIAYYNTIGDSLTTMEASVYPVVKALPKNYYNTINPADYCDMNNLYGKRTYTTRNFAISDSLYGERINNVKYLTIKLPIELGERFLKEARKPTNAFESKEEFTEFFKGLYITPTFGRGSLLSVTEIGSEYGYLSGTSLRIYYKYIHTVKENGIDKLVMDTTFSYFGVTKEIVQLNKIENGNEEELLAPDSNTMYIKTPSGICPKLIIPIPELAKKYKGKALSNVQLTLYAYEQALQKYSLGYPSKVILIEPDSVKTFFENQKLTDRVTTYPATYSNHVYTFPNISYLIQKAIKEHPEHPDKNLELLVIPISPTYINNSSGQLEETGYNNLLAPTGISLKKGDKHLKLQIISVEKKE